MAKQQHLVLVPEESSDHVAWRILGCRAVMLDPGPQEQVRSAPTPGQDRTDDHCAGERSGRSRSTPRGLFLTAPVQEGSDMLRGGRGTATVLPASGLCVCWFWQSRWLVIFSGLMSHREWELAAKPSLQKLGKVMRF